MNKKLALIVFVAVGAFVVFKLGFLHHTPFLNITNEVKIAFEEIRSSAKEFAQRHFYQAKSIERLRKENEELKKENALLDTFASEVVNLSKLKRYKQSLSPKMKTVRAISYVSLPDFNKLWIDFEDFNASKIYGLIYNGTAAGIVVSKNGNQSLALLNGDSKCSYAVYVGSKEYPGIAMGKRNDLMLVKYIPSWAKIDVGDEVFTSGLDNIFIEGVKVGVVTNVRDFNLYQEVELRPYYDSLKPDFFYLILSPR